jgi:aldehyde:ferredoxin oxidoreductase
MKYKGYKGKILTVDLSRSRIGSMPLSDEMVELYLGGRGLATRILYDELRPGIEPFSVDNKVLFITGPAAGTLLPTSARFAVGVKSPLNSTLNVSYAGGFFAPELKYAGYDGILISGVSKNPVYLFIDDDSVELRDAAHLWGKDCFETEEMLKGELGWDFQIAGIGPAGENLVHMANVMHEQHTAGRGGSGAIMGHKKLKAVAVRGSGGVEMALPPEDAIREAKALWDIIRANPIRGFFRKFGTTGMLGGVNGISGMPTRNFQDTYFEGTDKLLAEVLAEYIVRFESCPDCCVACGSVVKVDTPEIKLRTERVEHQTVCSFGPYCGVDNLPAIIQAGDLCDRHGMDTISTGTTIAFAMELYERGILTREDTDGLELRFGNGSVFKPLLAKIAHRERGIGELLSLGSRQAAEKIGGEASKYAMQVKGLEMPAYDPRAFTGMALNLATAQRGADHNKAFTIAAEFLGVLGDFDRFDTRSKPALTKKMQDSTAVIDSIIMCMFTVDLGISVELYGKSASIVTGMEIDAERVYDIGERINNLERMFNVREGIDGKYDALPERFATKPAPVQGEGHTVDVREMLPEYYRLRGWDENGVPTPEKLKELSLRV